MDAAQTLKFQLVCRYVCFLFSPLALDFLALSSRKQVVLHYVRTNAWDGKFGSFYSLSNIKKTK